MTNSIAPWYSNPGNIARLLRWLALYDLSPEVLELLEKPWHWDAEWKRCEAWLPPEDRCNSCGGEGRVEDSNSPECTELATCDWCEGSGKASGFCRECEATTPADTLTTNRGLCFRCQPYESPVIAKADRQAPSLEDARLSKADYEPDLAKDERGVA